MLISLVIWTFQTPALNKVVEFEIPEEILVEDPYSMAFSPNGQLFVLDRRGAKVLVWSAAGDYKRSFGRKGQGPGEFQYPARIACFQNEIWIQEHFGKKILKFDLNGTFLESFPIPYQIAAFSAADKTIFTAYFRNGPQKELIFSSHASEEHVIRRYPDKRFPRQGTMTAYSVGPDIQHNGDFIYFGYSGVSTLLKLDHTGRVMEELNFEFPQKQVSSEEEEYLKELTFSVYSGAKVPFDSDRIKKDFNHPKAPYSQFLIRGERIAFVSTPIGGLFGVGNGFNRATYMVYNIKDQERIHQGSYNLTEGSMVL